MESLVRTSAVATVALEAVQADCVQVAADLHVDSLT